MNSLNFQCALCNDRITSNLNKRHCGHEFHQECLSEWNKNFAGCPQCNADLIRVKNQSSIYEERDNRFRSVSDIITRRAEIEADDTEENRQVRREAQEKLNKLSSFNILTSLFFNFLSFEITENKIKILLMLIMGLILINKFII